MKRIIFLVLLFALAGGAKANQTSENKDSKRDLLISKSSQVAKSRQKSFKLMLFTQTEPCPSGYGGQGVTYWIVYDDVTGAVAGYGAYNQCYPVNYV